MTEEDFQRLQQEARAFRNRFDTVSIATSSPDGTPDLSYAPFILDPEERICIYISELAAHTRNLRENPVASLAFLAEEKQAHNLFARQRLILQCRARSIEEQAARQILDAMEARFGNTVSLLRSLGDFRLFCLEVESGSFIKGFGQAWSLQGNDLAIQTLQTGRKDADSTTGST